ncbi:Hsp70 family protein [Streptomyces nymphaeiformis]|uniref:Actin-like ATPase involved in cell morphogenesis n=1 Tax=Streptomyces nymphaeiformis TaxID=2663842 RepID=A0A7W7U1U9_9ACTN|nr:Hsp70 family protein [Streptomyces nymphaeiformis]MBB4983406.1 actin-like ATPase involved in cell morphogenesis [Streptomyces nymphaeiformis]
MKKQKVAVAIDFGTHGTGYAWALIDDDKRQVHPYMRWKDQPAPTAKNLTALLLDSEGDVLAWGYEARRRFNSRSAGPDVRYLKAFKMSLAPASTEGMEVGELTATSLSADEAKNLVTLYLKQIFRLAVEEVAASGFTEEEIRWCLTVPAIWGDYEKQLMREAAVAAGLPDDPKRLLLAYEPEVAAHHARVSGARTAQFTGKRPSLMSVGSRFLVADCGGGTVDITAYRAVSGNKLEEIGRECGGKFGSEYVNQAFLEKVLVPRFGSYDAIDRINDQQPAALLGIIEKWEEAKLHFSAEHDDEIIISIPVSIDRCLDEESRKSLAELQDGVTDEIVITAKEAQELFEEVVPGILSLVDKQLGEMRSQRRNAPGKELVVLVGGFGNSPYLRQRLQQHLEGRADLLVPPDPQAAVLFGAVHYACSPQIRARRARMTYGIASTTRFRPGVDPEEYRYEGPDYPLCRNRFSVYVRGGESIPVGNWVTRGQWPIWPDQDAMSLVVYAAREGYPQYVTDKGSQKIGSLRVDLSSVMHLPLSRRKVQVSLQFGETEIQVTAVLQESGEKVEAVLDFEPLS